MYTDDQKLISRRWKEITASSKVSSTSRDESEENMIKEESNRKPKPKRKWSSDEEDRRLERPAKK